MQNKLEVVTVRTEEAEGRLSVIDDKIMGNDEAEKKRQKLRKKEIKKFWTTRGELEN